MTQLYYHYTSRYGAQGIMASREIVPRYPGGRVYFSDKPYGSGANASDKLAIVGKAVEICLIVPRNRISGLSVGSPVAQLRDSHDPRRILRAGGGIEHSTLNSVSVDGSDILEMRAP